MKKILAAAFLLLAVAAHAQKTGSQKSNTTKTATSKTPVTKTNAAKPAATGPLKNKVDSVSYAIGFMVANFYKNQQGIQELNPEIVAKAVRDIYANKTTLMNENQCNSTLMRYMNPAMDKTIAEGDAFLAKNKKKAGVVTTASGLQYEVIVQGTGARPAATDTVIAHYAGSLLNGEEFDNSYKRGQPLTIGASQVIRGWTEGLQLMPVGSKYKFYIPYDLAYGLNDQGPIPGGSVLVFEVELLGIKKL
jgi:FKBP-type peptidyl-prolyl cis-trans isomerase